MAASIPTTEPSSLRAGDTWQWRREDLADYPASAWTLVYYFRNASAHFDITASADGDAYAVTVAKASSGKAPGWYDWIAVVSSATERHEVDRGRLEILPDYATAAVLDGRSTARRILEAIDALILGRASADQVDTVAAALGDRSLARDRAMLLTYRDRFRAEVRREEDAERIRQGLGARNRVLTRFA